MPLPNKRWNKGRKTPKTRSVRRILILCEDEKSSRDYLERFPYNHNQIHIDCVGTGANTDSLMEEAISRLNKAIKQNRPYSQIWVVFDRDSFLPRQFNRAFDLSKSYGEIIPCWSNECFELWYLLHFCYRDTGIGREEIKTKISRYLGNEYEKNDKIIYDKLITRIDTAIKNAGRLAFQNIGDQRRNPSTQVHELVKMLRELDPDKQK